MHRRGGSDGVDAATWRIASYPVGGGLRPEQDAASTTYYLLLATCHLLLTTYCLLQNHCYLLPGTYYSLFTTFYFLLATYH